MGKLQSIQILRFVAAALVVLTHATGTFSIGFVGVDIFFVISGFIIARMLPAKTFAPFVRDRFTRIFPIYWLAVAIRASAIIPSQGWDIEKTAASLTLWPVYSDFTFPYLFVGWTLCFEVLFYAAAAATLLNRRAFPALLAGYGCAVALAFATGLPLFRFLGNPLILEFLFGVAVANFPYRDRRIGAACLGLAPIVMFAFASSALGVPENTISLASWYRPIVWGIPAAMLVWGALNFEPKGRTASLVAYGGDASYSIYLVHTIILWQLHLILLWWPIGFLVSVVVGVAVHRFVERPLLAVMRRRKITRHALA